MKTSGLLPLFLIAIVHASAACSGSDVSVPNQSADSGAPAAQDSGPTNECEDLTDLGPPAAVQAIADDPPNPAGGTIADGTYFVTEWTVFTGKTGFASGLGTARAVIRITNNGTRIAAHGDDSTGTVHARVTTSGSDLALTYTCNTGGDAPAHYTATANTFTVFYPPKDGSTVVTTFTRQP
jgi:hypothetical protein